MHVYLLTCPGTAAGGTGGLAGTGQGLGGGAGGLPGQFKQSTDTIQK